MESEISRKLKEHQLKAAFHLLSVQNGANFSVPGSGKTTVVLTVFQWLKKIGVVDSLFVVGPPACFGPWITEYKETIGEIPSYEIFAGGDIENRKANYLVNKNSVCDIYLTTFQTLQRDSDEVRILFKQQGINFYFVVDEAHYIKQIDGNWANAVLSIAKHSSRRTILTGTPFPRTYSDAYNLFDFLWPVCSPITSTDRHKIEYYAQKHRLEEAADTLNNAIGPLFYRVRKTDLGLAAQKMHPPIKIEMKKNERFVYDSILDKIREITKTDYFKNIDLLLRLRRGRMMRLRQCLSYTKLMSSAVYEYDEDLLKGDLSLAEIIKHYDKIETPAKLDALMSLLQTLLDNGEKVLIWSNFVQTLKLIHNSLNEMGHKALLIYGATPIQKRGLSDEWTREEIIRQFLSFESKADVLIANPAALAESVSLHKACSNAIYYDLSYNCAQYLQSIDRIHRVGGSENKIANYYFLQYKNTIDDDILKNVQTKADNMNRIIDQDYPIYSLDMFAEDDELEAYERIFGNRNGSV